MGAMLSIRFTVLSGGAIILLALPFIILAEDSFRSFGLIFLIGSLVSMYTALAAPAPLLMATSDLVISSNPNRKQGKRR
jgi:preprotein translocase subunit SecF